MVVYIAIDDEKGLMFNHRRQSQDRILRADILADCSGDKLWMHSYSAPLFETESGEQFIIDDAFLDKAEEADYCYVETDNLVEYEDKISKLILYRWNRLYPADLYFEINLSNWTRIESKDFAGSSHDKITKEVWVRNV